MTWNNAPGARFTSDAGGGAPSTYVRSLGQAKERIKQHLKDKDEADATRTR